MIDTDKEVQNILFDLGVEGNEYGDLVEYISNLLAEVKRLRGIIAGIVTDMDEDWRFWRSELKKVIE